MDGGIFAGVADEQLRGLKNQQYAMRLNPTQNVNRFTVASIQRGL
jgi:hypothetical protein